jgi:hypothetical protein
VFLIRCVDRVDLGFGGAGVLVAATARLHPIRLLRLQPHLGFAEELVSYGSCHPPMARVGCLVAVGEEVAAAALWAFCSLASTPSRWRTLRRRREAWSPCSGGRKTVGGCFCWWRRRPFGEDDGSGAGWRPGMLEDRSFSPDLIGVERRIWDPTCSMGMSPGRCATADFFAPLCEELPV